MDWLEILRMSLQFDQNLERAIALFGSVAYVMLFAIVFSEIALFPLFFLPGDPLLFVCGALCATGAMKVWIVAPVLFVASVSGSIVSYAIGAAIGEKLYTTDRRWLNKAALYKTRAFYDRRGGGTFLLSPFIAVVRTFAPLVAGIARMHFSRFVASVTAGAALWVATLVTAGYFFGSIPVIHDHLTSIVLLGLALGLGCVAVGVLWRFAKRPV